MAREKDMEKYEMLSSFDFELAEDAVYQLSFRKQH